MKCARCTKEIEKNMPQDGVCQNCFLELIEHRAKKALSKQNLKKGDKILIIDDGSKEFYAADFLFRKLMDKVPLTIDTKKKETVDVEKAQKEYTAIIVPQDMDDAAETLIIAMINNKQLKKDKTINVLENIYDREVKLFADIKKFKYTEQEQSDIKKALNKIETKHPNSEFAMLQSLKAMKNK